MYQAAQLTCNCAHVWVIYSQNTPSSRFVDLLTALLTLHSPEHTFVITLSLLKEEANVI